MQRTSCCWLLTSRKCSSKALDWNKNDRIKNFTPTTKHLHCWIDWLIQLPLVWIDTSSLAELFSWLLGLRRLSSSLRLLGLVVSISLEQRINNLIRKNLVKGSRKMGARAAYRLVSQELLMIRVLSLHLLLRTPLCLHLCLSLDRVLLRFGDYVFS